MSPGLYDAAVQVVPVLMIALFLDRRTVARVDAAPTLWLRAQQHLYLVLCISAFVIALLVLAGVIVAGVITDAVVLAALIGCIGLMAAQAWTRMPRRGESTTRAAIDPP